MAWHGNSISGAAGATHRIPDALADEFEDAFSNLIPGFAWVVQDESTDSSVTDHGGLSGLTGDDDHTQYIPIAQGVVKYADHGNAGAAVTINVTSAIVHHISLNSASCTVTLTGAVSTRGGSPASPFVVIECEQDSAGGRVLVWPASVDFGDATDQPDTTADALSTAVLYSIDGGTTWRAFWAGTGSGFTGGTPALTLGISNAAGSATTGIRTDASIAIFDAVAPAAIGPAATGTAAFAARRDHVHELTVQSASMTADQTMAQDTKTDVTNCSVSLTAGDWLILGKIVFQPTTNSGYVLGEIANSSNTAFDEARGYVDATNTKWTTLPLMAVVSPGSTTTFKLRAVVGHGSIVVTKEQSAGETYTRIIAVKIG